MYASDLPKVGSIEWAASPIKLTPSCRLHVFHCKGLSPTYTSMILEGGVLRTTFRSCKTCRQIETAQTHTAYDVGSPLEIVEASLHATSSTTNQQPPYSLHATNVHSQQRKSLLYVRSYACCVMREPTLDQPMVRENNSQIGNMFCISPPLAIPPTP